jgi:hypothetical protein
MTEKDTRDGTSLLFGALAVLTPVALLAVIAAIGNDVVPGGLQILLFALPAVVMALVLATGARLLRP